ncbi:bifunctional (p)ppGpp synthetase/guanosine-3',5'-bis(diphosphate) 3'-pyrophosphohydrolase [Desulfopila sp. IMCC35006]|uniref:HD domain-containing protein n=1 Tax=Desulfopila sp. IMCC35006 TaxID=2569542 RepID=UPI0010AC31C3|nr:HD domain-containing protein [Desulfopila sp. IMCC35006]TKB23552.1 bifunctional (p)ppGpp synthetase/guanosine-3',5'-bis(diphosphate) 3'-pyrophosphohydrolase [Desulfopila sp. IMCC35006]
MRRISFDLELYRNQMLALIGDKPETETFWQALDFSVEAHADQWRRSGDAYILHPCSVAKILAEEMDITHPEILAAALLHDTVEDVEEITADLVGQKFGSYVQAIVEGCTKVTHVSGDKQANSQNTHRKIFSGAALRPEVMLVKLADRLHNLRTLMAMPKAKRQRIADETIDIYAPLATVFGLFNMKREMYNLALLYKYPKQGARLNNHIRQLQRSPLGQTIVENVLKNAEKENFSCKVTVRTKKLWAYYDLVNRILVQRIDTPLEILIVVDDVQSCYRALGIANQTYKPIPRTIRDFIANPKPTGYQGLHAKAIVEGQKFLFKIRTDEMERKAQKGLFRNWSSKAGKQVKFIREIQELFDVIGSEDSFSYRDVIAASGRKEIYTYTPQGDLICLPVNSTILDFAFRVHTEIGQTCLGAMIRNKRVPPSHILKDGDMVRIVRAERPIRFEQHMLAMCKTPRARGELAKNFRVRCQKVTREVGVSMLRQEMLRYGIPFDVLEGKDLPELLAHEALPSLDELYVRIGEGRVHLKELMEDIKNIMYGGVSPLVTPTGAFNKIELTTLDPVSVKLSSCCKPNPTAKDNCALLTPKGLSVHHKNCERFRELKFQREDAVDISWKIRQTHVRKQQILHILRATRKSVMQTIGSAPLELDMQRLEILSSYSSLYPAWELVFRVVNLYDLQRVLKHFDKSGLPYEFDLDC